MFPAFEYCIYPIILLFISRYAVEYLPSRHKWFFPKLNLVHLFIEAFFLLSLSGMLFLLFLTDHSTKRIDFFHWFVIAFILMSLVEFVIGIYFSIYFRNSGKRKIFQRWVFILFFVCVFAHSILYCFSEKAVNEIQLHSSNLGSGLVGVWLIAGSIFVTVVVCLIIKFLSIFKLNRGRMLFMSSQVNQGSLGRQLNYLNDAIGLLPDDDLSFVKAQIKLIDMLKHFQLYIECEHVFDRIEYSPAFRENKGYHNTYWVFKVNHYVSIKNAQKAREMLANLPADYPKRKYENAINQI